MGDDEEEDYAEDEDGSEESDVVAHNQELLEQFRENQRQTIAEQLLENLPQGEGSTLDADTVDGLHARDILGEIAKTKRQMIGPLPLSGGAGGTGDMTKAVYDTDNDGVVDNSQKLEGSTKVQVQNHAPSAHTHQIADLTDHNTAAHDALNIDADTVDGSHAADFAPAAKGVTNGDAHDHNGGDGAQIDHVNLANKGTNTHAQVDTHLAASAPHGGHEVTTAKDAANGYAGLSAATKLAAGQMPAGTVAITLTFSIPDALATGQKKMRILAPCAITLTKVCLVVDTAPTGANLIVDVHTGTGAGTTIFTTQGNRPTIVAGNKTGVSVAPDVTSIAEADEFSVYVDQIGSTIAGSDLTIEVIGTQTVAFT